MIFQNFLNRIYTINRENFVIFILFYFIAIIFYYPSFDSRVVFDQAEYIVEFEKYGFGGIFKCFYMNCITGLYFQMFIDFVMYKIFGPVSILNGLFAVLIHSINSFLIYKIFRIIQLKYNNNEHVIYSYLVGLIFLICPYATEPIVWGCTIHYLFLLLFFLIAVFFIFKDANFEKFKYRFIVFGAHFLSLFTHEISFVFIPVFFLFYYLIKDNFLESIIGFSKKYLPYLISSQLICFAIRYIEYGSFIGHYGAKVHLSHSIKESLTNFNLYSLKYTFLFNNLHVLDPLRAYIHQYIYWFVFYELILVTILIWTLKRHFFKKELGILLIAFSILIFPSLNLYFPDYHKIQGDRLGYLASSVYIIFIGMILLNLNFKKLKFIKYLYLSFIVLFSGYTLFTYNYNWKTAAQLMSKIENTDLGKGNTYYFLNMPESYRGAYIYKTGNRTSPLKYRAQALKQEYPNEIIEVASVNLTDINNKLNIKKLDSLSYYVQIDSPNGSWFWRGNSGATNYETDNYTLKLDQWGGYYLKLKSLPISSYLLHYKDGELAKIKLN